MWHSALEVAGLLDSPKDSGQNSALDPLVQRAAAGDHSAFVVLYRAHFKKLRAFSQRLLGCETAADDLVHDVFAALPGVLARFRGDCSLESYLLSVTIRRARSYLRSAQRRRALELRASQQALEPIGSLDADTEQRELGRLLTRALDALPLDQRVAFVLCEVEERSSSEAAEILGEKPGTVRARVFHAKRKLRERLAELSPGERAP